jgi:hypothetical protein
LFVEKEQAHYSALKALCAQYTRVQHEVLQGDFWQMIPEVSKKTAGQPVFIVVDPFGVKGLDYQKLASLCNASPKCDLVVTFVSSAIPRLEAQYPAAIELAIGSRATGDTSAAQTFARNMATAGGFCPGGRFPIKQSFNSAKSYELIVFSRSAHAYRLWNDFVTWEWKQLIRLKPKLGGRQPVMEGFAEALEEAGAGEERKEGANEILAWTETAMLERFSRGHMLDEFAINHFGDFNSSTLNQAIKLLDNQQRIGTAMKARNDSTVWTVLSREPV